jgi:hypothetical protein
MSAEPLDFQSEDDPSMTTQKKNTGLFISGVAASDAVGPDNFGAQMGSATPQTKDKLAPARPRFASNYSSKKSPRKARKGEPEDDESMLEFEKLENYIGKDDVSSQHSKKSKISSYRKPGINSSKNSNIDQDSEIVQTQGNITGEKETVKAPPVKQHGCCYSVFCCAPNPKPEEDGEVSLARPIKKPKSTSEESKPKKKKGFLGGLFGGKEETVEEQDEEDEESQVALDVEGKDDQDDQSMKGSIVSREDIQGEDGVDQVAMAIDNVQITS